MTDVTLSHPDAKQPIKVREGQTDAYESQGWTEAPSKSEKSDSEK